MPEEKEVERCTLRIDDLGKAKAAEEQDHPNDGQTHGQFIANRLSAGAQGPEERIFIIAAVAGEQNAKGGETGDAQDKDNPNTEIVRLESKKVRPPMLSQPLKGVDLHGHT